MSNGSHRSRTYGTVRFFFWSNDSTWGGHFYDPATDSWEAITTTAAPVPRINAASAWAGDRFILWGGQQSLGGLQNTGFIFKE